MIVKNDNSIVGLLHTWLFVCVGLICFSVIVSHFRVCCLSAVSCLCINVFILLMIEKQRKLQLWQNAKRWVGGPCASSYPITTQTISTHSQLPPMIKIKTMTTILCGQTLRHYPLLHHHLHLQQSLHLNATKLTTFFLITIIMNATKPTPLLNAI